MDHLATVDKISDLPWDTLDNILGRLPIKDTVRTSILSRKWRDKWVDISKLVFDEQTDFASLFELVNLVYHVLLSHRGQINKFMLSTRYFDEHDHLDRWILFLSKNNIKEIFLDLDLSRDDIDLSRDHPLPSCLFSCQQLSHLYLTHCSVVIPHTFNGFRNLVSLQLKIFSSDDEVLENLIRSCPILETLVLSRFSYDSDCLNIYAPYLRSLYLKGEFRDVYLENSPHLTDASFKMTEDFTSAEHRSPGMAHNLICSPVCQSHFERLTLSGYFIKLLATRCVPQGVLIACDHLKVLKLSKVHFDELDEISFILSLLQSSSNLKELYISISGQIEEDVYKFMKEQDQLNYSFEQLRVVKIDIDISGFDTLEAEYYWRSDLELIKLVLACSPILEKMVINYVDPFSGNLWLMEQLLSLKRASSKLLFKYLFNAYR